MIDGYQNKNIDQTLDAVSDWSAVELQRFLVFERQEKDRKGVIDAVQSMLVTVEAPDTGYYGGFWFDDAGERVMKDSPRLRRALSRTELVKK